MNLLARLGILAALCASAFSLVACGPPEPADPETVAAPGEEIELGVVMMAIERRTEKLYWAGKAGNRELASFYLEEIEESASEVYGLDVMEGESNVSELMEALIPFEVGRLRDVVENQPTEAFLPAFDRMMQACNACHQATAHGFIVVGEPPGEPGGIQRFGP